jgi:hypothetical protein
VLTGQLDAVNGLGLLVLLEGRARQVAAHNGLNLNNLELADDHAPILHSRGLLGSERCRHISADKVRLQTRHSFLFMKLDGCIFTEGE